MASIVEFLGFLVDALFESGMFVVTLIQGRNRFGARAFWGHLRLMAVQPLPVVSIFAISLGLILSSQAVRFLEVLNLESQMIEMIALALVRHFAPIVVGIFVAGRSGLALAVQLGDMVLRREIDALTLMDIDPLRFVVAPIFCVNLISIVALSLWFAALSVIAAGGFLEYWSQIPVTMLLGIVANTLSWSDILMCVVKGLVIGILVVVVSAFNGLTIDSHAQGLSRVATYTVVQSLLIVILVQLAFSLQW
ncbi:MAG: ABC transporter permease [Rhodospirillaceae bacterium]